MRINTNKSPCGDQWTYLFFGKGASFFDMNSCTDAKKYASMMKIVKNGKNKIVRRITPQEYLDMDPDHIPCCERCGYPMRNFSLEFDPVRRIHYREMTTMLVCPLCEQRKDGKE